MEITFADRKLKKECESQAVLQAVHGQACARKIGARIADLQAVAALSEVASLPGRCHELVGDRKGQLAIDVSGGKRLVFEPAAMPAPTKHDGGLDWTAVRAIRLLAIENYHRG